MIPFSLEMPRTIQFGRGALRKLPETVRETGVRVMILSGGGWLRASPWEAAIEEGLKECTVLRYFCSSAEPSVRSVDAAAAAAASFEPEVLVAVGGGSVLDTTKALSALVRHPGSAERYLEGISGAAPVPGPGLPWIAVPTTSGTGAEATKNAVIKSESAGVKRSMRSRHLLAHAVLVDPELTLSLPPSVTGTSGLDALTQLVEAYVSRSTTPPVRSLVEGAFPLMWDALNGLTRAPKDIDLREKASYGALVSGVALANAGLGAAHGFAAAVGGMFDVPHGLACAVFLPHVLAANKDVVAPDIGRLVGVSHGKEAARDPVGWLAAEAARFLDEYGLPRDLRGFDIPREKVPELAEKSSGSSMKGNPRELSMKERADILLRVV
ncbi:MAG: iron-containing alcohol dehydrogenase [Spirochaetia bacterium]|jgi:alcohol dehydrogenase class IV